MALLFRNKVIIYSFILRLFKCAFLFCLLDRGNFNSGVFFIMILHFEF